MLLEKHQDRAKKQGFHCDRIKLTTKKTKNKHPNKKYQPNRFSLVSKLSVLKILGQIPLTWQCYLPHHLVIWPQIASKSLPRVGNVAFCGRCKAAILFVMGLAGESAQSFKGSRGGAEMSAAQFISHWRPPAREGNRPEQPLKKKPSRRCKRGAGRQKKKKRSRAGARTFEECQPPESSANVFACPSCEPRAPG